MTLGQACRNQNGLSYEARNAHKPECPNLNLLPKKGAGMITHLCSSGLIKAPRKGLTELSRGPRGCSKPTLKFLRNWSSSVQLLWFHLS